MLLHATPGWVSLPVVVCGPPPLLAGVCWRRWCVVWGVWCVVCGVWCVVCGGGVRRWCAGGVAAGVWCGWFLATPGGGSCVLLPATSGWVSLPAVVGVPRHSWRRVPGAVPRHSWLGFAVGGGVWCVVCGVWRAAVACVVGLWLVCGVVGPLPLLAEVPVCYSPPLLAGFRCRWWCGAPRHSWLGPAGCGGVFRGRGCPLLCVFVVCVGVRGGRAVLCVACLWCLCFWWCDVVVRWVGLPGALLLGPGVCVCAVWPFLLVWVARGGEEGRARCGCRACACVCLRCVVGGVGCVIPWLVLVVGRRHGSKSRRRGPVDAQQKCVACVMRSTYLSFCPTMVSSPVEKERAQVLFFFFFCVLCFVSPPFFFFCVASSITYLSALCFPYRENVEGAFVFFFVFFCNILVIPCAASCCRHL